MCEDFPTLFLSQIKMHSHMGTKRQLHAIRYASMSIPFEQLVQLTRDFPFIRYENIVRQLSDGFLEMSNALHRLSIGTEENREAAAECRRI